VTRARLRRDLAIGLAVGTLIAILALRFPFGLIPGDAFTYLAAGERLNAGHALYGLAPGDRPIHLEPPYWTVPLLTPPIIGVLWRPLAAFLGEPAVGIWWIAHIISVTAAFILVARRRPVIASAALVILAFPFAYELSVGNLNGFILLGLVLTWRESAAGRERATGLLSGLLASFKVTPALLVWWLVTSRRWQATGWAIATGLVILAVSLVGAGMAAHFDYLEIVRSKAGTAPYPASLGGIAAFLGVRSEIADLLPVTALVVGTAGIWLLRHRRDRAFQLAVVTVILGSPAVSISWYVLLFATLAPLAWPVPRPTGLTGAAAEEVRARGRGGGLIVLGRRFRELRG
jgi:hypothetical protein